MTKKKYIHFLLFLMIVLTISSCAPKGTTYNEYGFFSGILHGILLPFAVVGKIFGTDIGIHALNNSGTFYWVGYLMGLSALGGGASKS